MSTPTAKVPDLPKHCGSWIVSCNATGTAVLETYDRRVAEAINTDKYTVHTAAAWLASLNSK